MEITKVITDSEGNSRFEEWPINMEKEWEFGYISDPQTNVKSFHFQNTLPHHEWSFHQAPDKVYIVILSGELELETTDAEKRTFTKGEVICLEDDSGKGHKTKTGKGEQRSLIIHFD